MEIDYLKTGICKSESPQSDKNKAQLVDSSNACNKTRVFKSF